MRTKHAKGDYPFVDTEAAQILRGAIAAQKAQGTSLRSLAKKVGVSAAVLSHMGNGRIGVPLDRATAIANAVELDERSFLAAAVAQRAPGAYQLLAGPSGHSFDLAAEIRMIAGKDPDDLTEEQKAVIREVVADLSPRRRWLSIAELPAVTLLRKARPELATHGLAGSEMNFLEAILSKGP
jgi:hypothetical protein